MILYHIIALVAGVILDLIIGDPYRMPHPIRLIGRFIGWLDKRALPPMKKNDKQEKSAAEESGENTESKDISENKNENSAETFPSSFGRDPKEELRKGKAIVIVVVLSAFLATAAVIVLAYLINPWIGAAAETVLTAYVLAAKSLKTESMKVYKELKSGTIESARYAVSMIVGRDTDALDKEGVTKAAVETVAENTSDGVIAPLLYTALGGPILGMTYKAVNTMDSMIGYKNDRYLYLGRAAAKLDDVVNYLPSRLSAWLIIFATWLLKHFGTAKHIYSPENARRIFLRDRYNHKSPNSAQTESAVAGALGVQLAGDAVYFGKVVKKPTIGDPLRPVDTEDIARANRLMYAAFITAAVVCAAIWTAVFFAAG